MKTLGGRGNRNLWMEGEWNILNGGGMEIFWMEGIMGTFRK